MSRVSTSETIVLLHGFAGTRHTWDAVAAELDGERYRPLALDLPGHGDAAAVRPIGFQSCVADVLAQAPAHFTLGGYSLGGRIALHVALAAPERVSRLVLVSSTAGIEDEGERAQRLAADERLADEIVTGPFQMFIERWRDQPLFSGDPPHVRAAAVADQLRNRPDDLAAALRGLSTGAMTPLWRRLGELTMPVTVLAGERDAKFRALAGRLAAALPDAHLCVVPGGHALALESPAAVAAALRARR